MNRKNDKLLLVTFIGIIILCLFSGIIIFNMYKDNSNSYFARTSDSNIKQKVNITRIDDNQIKLKVDSGIIKYCIKDTIKIPQVNNVCWKSFNNNEATVKVMLNEKRYLWILDDNNTISDSILIQENTINKLTNPLDDNIEKEYSQEVEVKYNYNLFKANSYPKNSIVNAYNNELQIIRFLGNMKEKYVVLGIVPIGELSGINIKAGEKYKLTVNYVGGEYEAKSDPPVFVMEFLINEKDAFPNRTRGKDFVDGVLPIAKNAPLEKTITITEDIVKNAKNLRFRIWQKNKGEATFKNLTNNLYRIQVFVTKVESKSVYVDKEYGKMPTPVRADATFLGWYDSLSGNNKITETSIVTKNNTHTLYAHWGDINLKKDGTYVNITSNEDIKGYYFSKKQLSLNGKEEGWIESTKKNIDFVLLPGTYYIYIKKGNGNIVEKNVTITSSDITDTNNATLLTKNLDEFLSSKGSSMDELNNMFYRSIMIASMVEKRFDVASKGVTEKEITENNIRQAIVEYAKYAYENLKDKIVYLNPSKHDIDQGKIYDGYYNWGTSQYGMDCNAFVSFVLYNALQGKEYLKMGFRSVLAGPGESEWEFRDKEKYFSIKKFFKANSSNNEQTIQDIANNKDFRDSLKPGDIIGIVGYSTKSYTKDNKASHIIIYIGNGEYIHNNNGGVSIGNLDNISFGLNFAVKKGGLTVISPKADEIKNAYFFSTNMYNTIRYPSGKGQLITINKENISRNKAAITLFALTQALYKKYKIKLPYGYESDYNTVDIGINKEWGKEYSNKTPKAYVGLECGRFVAWGLRTAGFKVNSGCGSSSCYTHSLGEYKEIKRDKISDIKNSFKDIRIADALTFETNKDYSDKKGRHISLYIASDNNGVWVVESNAQTQPGSNGYPVVQNNIGMVTTYDKFDAKFRWLSSGSLRKTYNNIENDKIRSDIIVSSGKTGF